MIAYRLLNDVCIDCLNSMQNFDEDQESYFECLFEFPKKDRVKQAEIALQICDYNSVYSYIEKLKSQADKLGILNLEKMCEELLVDVENENYNDITEHMDELRISYDNIVDVINKARISRE